MTIWIGEEGVSRLVLLVLDLKLTILQGNLAKVSCIHGGYIVGTVNCDVKIPLGDLHQHNLIKNGMLVTLPILNTSFQKYSVHNFYTIIDRRCLGV